MFVDKVRLTVQSGNGGNGMIHLKRTSKNPKAGPDGGNGGDGGSIYLLSDINISDLSHLTTKKIYKAEDGKDGGVNKCNGKKGCDLILKIPVGSVVKILDNDDVIDFDQHGILYKILDGGRGGFGNAHFVSSIRQTPRFAELGEKGKQIDIEIELKLIADVGIVGLPNAGKSTFISVISNAKPKIADYPFTTLVPNLGVVKHNDSNFVCADIPGLIEGAHKGKGLGIEFLKHIERCLLILHLISVDSDDIYRDFKIIENELKKYSVDLYNKKRIIVLTKMDIYNYIKPVHVIDFEKKLKNKYDIFFISSVTHFNINALLDFVLNELKIIKSKLNNLKDNKINNFAAQNNINRIFGNEKVLEDIIVENSNIPIYTLTKKNVNNIRNFSIRKINNMWIIDGMRINQIANMTDENNIEAMERLYDVLKKIGVSKYLKKNNASPNDILVVGNKKIKTSDVVDFSF